MQLRKVGPKELHVVTQLCHRAHGGTGGPDRVALLDGDGRRDSLDAIHLGLIHPVEELPGVGGERLDVPPLALGEQGVKGQ